MKALKRMLLVLSVMLVLAASAAAGTSGDHGGGGPKGRRVISGAEGNRIERGPIVLGIDHN